jgi:hypothetical protein
MTIAANSAKEIAWAVQESALGTMMTSPVAGTNSVYPRLAQGSFGMTADDVQEDILTGGGYGIGGETVSDHYEAKGSLKIPLYASQFLFWMNFCTARIDLTNMLPWPSSEQPGDLASLSFYHNVRTNTGTRIIERFAGTKCASWTLEVSRKSTYATLAMELVAARCYPHVMDASAAPSDFVYPADTDMPTDPLTFKDTSGGLTIGSVRVGYDSISISGKNTLSAQWFETAHLQCLEFCGRQTSLDAELWLKASPDDKTTFQTLTAQAAALVFSHGGHTYTIDFKGKNVISKLPYDLPATGTFMRKLSLKNLYDPSAGNDITVSYA